MERLNNNKNPESRPPEFFRGTDMLRFEKDYDERVELWDAAFNFLKGDLAAMAPGKYVLIEGQLIANISEYLTRPVEEARWEAHRKFIDLQYVIAGAEQIGIKPLASAVLAGEYDAENDVVFFAEQEGKFVLADPAKMFLFFPEDVHRPGVLWNSPAPVKKLVLKIAAE
ncbi:MAG: YhcH/YjgK/YiaL family protein [Bacteroidales bacterium]|jgi:YhcH/YjgK/YiaL family protein|nr:YhcH/YjgK/YiaL family protein [Bacteroidales bacterium]